MRASVDRALRRLDAPAFGDRALVADRPRAHTLHRLLGFSPRSGRFRHHPRNPLSHRFVIVDESSMIDLALMDRLLGAMPEDGQLVLLGDAHQLPSVDAGAVFRDLGQSGGPRIMTLTRSYRMDPRDPAGKNILTLARRIDAQDPDGLFEPHGRSKGSRSERIAIRSRQDEIRFEGVEWIETTTARGRERVLEHWYQQHVRSLPDLDSLTGRAWKVHGGQIAATGSADMARLFDHVDASRVLCLTRGRATGVNALNEWFHNRALRSAGTAAVASTGRLLLAGEPVLVQRNDYDKGLFNGDTGIVVRTVDEAEDETHPRHSVVFRREDGFLTFPLEAVRPLLDLAWAITVHKSQGSEYRHVAIVLPVTDTPLLTRELLYTAVTRSARSVLMMGPRAMLETGVRRALDRFSGVAPRLEGQAGQPG
jgi:exodeoxyribonuclease V alpha subunit